MHLNRMQKQLIFTIAWGYCKYEVAMAHDHLGYVLSDSAETYACAKTHLMKALHIWKSFMETNTNPDIMSAYATTCDNLGYLLFKEDKNIDEAERLLREALSIRNSLYEHSEQYATDVAWTSFNLGELMSEKSSDEAELHFRRSLKIRRKLD